MSEPAHRLLDDLDVRSQYVQPRPPVFFNSISGPLLDNLIWRNILRRGLWLWTLYHCNLCNLNVALNKMMMMMLMLIMITWIHYVSKKYRRQAEGKSHSTIGAWGTKNFSFYCRFQFIYQKKYSQSMQCTGADLGGGCRGCAPPPPEMTCGFLIQLVFCQKKNYVVSWCWSRARDECTPS